MQTAEMITGVKMLLKEGKLLKMFEPFVTGPKTSHWIRARSISAKPSVAMAR